MRKLTLICTLVILASGATAQARDHAPLAGEGQGLELVANVPYAGGTDMEFLTQNGRDYAVTGSAPGVASRSESAMRVIDITDPESPFLAATLRCALYQMDVQISHDGKTAILGADSPGEADSCAATGKTGFMTIDISDALNPRVAGFAEIAGGSHNITAHPTRPLVYNSEGGGGEVGKVEIWSIADPTDPRKVGSVAGGTHDLNLSEDGSLMVTAGSRRITVFDTSDPTRPRLLHQALCPCQIAHDVKFTPDARYVIAGDEAAGGAPTACPGGALWFFRLGEGGLSLAGAYEPYEIVTTGDEQGTIDACTSHVMDVSPDGKHVAVSWYGAGTRYLDISDISGVTFGPLQGGVEEKGWFRPEGGSSWASKFYKGPYIYSNDLNRGFDVFKITG